MTRLGKGVGGMCSFFLRKDLGEGGSVCGQFMHLENLIGG